MADYNINAVTRRVVFSGSAGVGPYAFTFEILAQTDIAVYKNSTKLTLTTDYTVTINANGTGSVTLVVAATGSDTITIIGSRAIERTTDFVTAGDLLASSLNEQLDSQIVMIQQLAEENKRTIKAPAYDPADVADGGTANLTLPAAADRANQVLAFDASGNPIATEEIGEWKGNWATATTYAKRDIVKDASNSNVYRANTAHTSSGSTPISSNADVAKWDLIVDAAAAGASAAAAAASEAAAAASEAAAAASEAAAAASEAAAATSETNAAASEAAAATSLDDFTDIYLGSKTSDPSTDNDGDPLVAGALYFNSVVGELRVYSGSAWQAGTAGAVAVQRFNGDASTVAFTLATEPSSENNTQVYISGVYQQKDTYSVSGTTLTFSAAPPSGTGNIEVVSISTLAIGEVDPSTIKTAYESNADTNAFTDGDKTKLDSLSAIVKTLTSYGCAGDGDGAGGGTNDATNLQSAITAAVAAGYTLDGENKIYRVDSPIAGASNLILKNATFDYSNLTGTGTFPTATGKTYMYFQGTGSVDSSALASNATKWGYSVTVTATEGSKFAAGDWVQIRSEDAYDYSAATVKRAEIKQVQSVSTDTVTFTTPIYENYTTANTATLHKLSLVESVWLENLTFIGTGVANDIHVGLGFDFVNGLNVKNVTLNAVDYIAMYLGSVINFDVENPVFKGVRYTGTGSNFYGLALYSCCQWGTIRAPRGEQLRHLVTVSGTATRYGQPYHVVVSDGIMRNAQAGDQYASFAYESHGFGRWVSFVNCNSDGCYSGWNIENGNVTIIGGHHTGCRVAGIILSADTNTIKNVYISGLHISGATSDSSSGSFYGLLADTNASQVRQNIHIEFTLDEFGVGSRQNFVARVRAGSGQAYNCSISGKFVNSESYESTDYGLYVEHGGWTLDNCQFLNFERPVQIVSGADGCRITNIEVNVQSASGSHYAIDVDSDDNVIDGIVTRGAYAPVSVSGTGNKILNVSGYGTTSNSADTGSSNYWDEASALKTTSLTIATGAITLPGNLAMNALVYVNTESGAATDDLDAVNGGKLGQVVCFVPASSSRDVTFRDASVGGSANMRLAGSASFAPDDTTDSILLMWNSSFWTEISRSNN